MDIFFTICLLLGVGIPLISVIFGLFDHVFSLFDGLDWDFDFDIGDISISLIPASGAGICGFLLLTGAAGKILLFLHFNIWLALGLAILCGYLAALAIQNFIINRLKRVRMEPNTKEELIGAVGTVLTTILPGTTGSVGFITKTGRITYPARCAGSQPIKQGVPVEAKGFDGNIIIVAKIDMEEHEK